MAELFRGPLADQLRNTPAPVSEFALNPWFSGTCRASLVTRITAASLVTMGSFCHYLSPSGSIRVANR